MATERTIELRICACRRHGHWILPDGTITDERSCQSLLLRELQVALDKHPMHWAVISRLEQELAKSGIVSHPGQASLTVINQVAYWNRVPPKERDARMTRDHADDPRIFEESGDQPAS